MKDEPVPRRVEALVGKTLVGAAAGVIHTAVWTDAGELFTYGPEYGEGGGAGQLGHGGQHTEHSELVPRLVEALAGKKVIGTAAGGTHTGAWTDAGGVFTFGDGNYGQLGHGGTLQEHVPKLVDPAALDA